LLEDDAIFTSSVRKGTIQQTIPSITHSYVWFTLSRWSRASFYCKYY